RRPRSEPIRRDEAYFAHDPSSSPQFPPSGGTLSSARIPPESGNDKDRRRSPSAVRPLSRALTRSAWDHPFRLRSFRLQAELSSARIPPEGGPYRSPERRSPHAHDARRNRLE